MIEWLARIPNFLRATAALILEGIRQAIEDLLSRVYQHGGMRTTISEPDKLSVVFATERT
jgi:hypothetical protein